MPMAKTGQLAILDGLLNPVVKRPWARGGGGGGGGGVLNLKKGYQQRSHLQKCVAVARLFSQG